MNENFNIAVLIHVFHSRCKVHSVTLRTKYVLRSYSKGEVKNKSYLGMTTPVLNR